MSIADPGAFPIVYAHHARLETGDGGGEDLSLIVGNKHFPVVAGKGTERTAIVHRALLITG